MGRRNRGKEPSLGDSLRNSSLLETAVRLQLPCGVIEHEDETIDLAQYHVHSLGVYLSAANQGPRVHLEFALHRKLEGIVDRDRKEKFPCDKLEGPFKAFLESGEVDYGGKIGKLTYLDKTQPETPPIVPALFSLERTFRASETENVKKREARLQLLQNEASAHPSYVRINFVDFVKALEGDPIQWLLLGGNDEWAGWTQRHDTERGSELFLGRIPNPVNRQVEKNGSVYFSPRYHLEGGAIVRLTAPVVESVKLLVGGLAKDERLKELVRDLYGT